MTRITTIGVDLAKNVMQVHGVDADGKIVVAQPLRRKQVLAFFAKQPSCLVGMEACGSAQHWARELTQARAQRAADAAEIREGLRQARQDGCWRCGGDLRSGVAPEHDVRGGEVGGTAGPVDAAQRAPDADWPAHAGHQRAAGAPERARHRGGARHARAHRAGGHRA